ncbi:MAG: hypothetical protein IPM15_17585 [Betaproteobacteria bacterium]|nr:hypothetical protein [Betaproteobacteria bacterium]MCC6246924.1 hypothetical protein [Rubrivivax sp.]MCL4696932.1 hypothetical protein [Burkholderiaceae bacterium]
MNKGRLLPRIVRAAALAAVAAWAAGCAPVPPAAGDARDAVVGRWGAPTARYTMPGGAERLEYATGPFGRTTWMIDLDSAGRVTGARQVLNEAHFHEFQQRAPGMSIDEVLRTLGTPGERKRVGWRSDEVWSWRYPTNDCLWFQVTVDLAAGRARDAGYGIDWSCDKPTEADRS